ncbi:MAG: ABC transporter permease [Calditrichaceae bacterium]
MRRHLFILAFFLTSMRRNWKWHLGVITIFSVVVFAYASIVFFIQSLSYETQQVLSTAPDITVQKIKAGRMVEIPDSLAQSISEIRGIKSVVPRVWGYYFDSPTGGVFTLIGADSLTGDLTIVEGKGIQPGDRGIAVCGTGFMETHYLRLQDNLSLFDTDENLHNFTITGRFSSPSDLLTRDLIILPIEDARKIVGLKQKDYSDLSVYVFNDDEIENISRKIDRRFASVRVVTKSEIKSTYEALFGYRGGLFMFGLLISLFAYMILAWQRASGISAEAKKELGILKAVGWEISDILLLKFWEGISISLTATLIGLIGAYAHDFIFQAPLLKPFLVGWSVIYPDFNLLPVVQIGSVLLILVLAVVPYIAATMIPSWKAAVIDPSEVMHA